MNKLCIISCGIFMLYNVNIVLCCMMSELIELCCFKLGLVVFPLSYRTVVVKFIQIGICPMENMKAH